MRKGQSPRHVGDDDCQSNEKQGEEQLQCSQYAAVEIGCL